jgi:aminoglycoside 6'-N-acetyltransferase
LHAATAADLDLVAGWFADPEFYRWWGGVPKTREEVAARRLGFANGDEIVYAFVAHDETRPVGYLQAWTDLPGIGGIDIVLIPEARDRGLGPDAVRTLARHCRSTLGWTGITIDPAVDNRRAIRAFEKAGFTPLHEFADAEGTYLVMEFRG